VVQLKDKLVNAFITYRTQVSLTSCCSEELWVDLHYLVTKGKEAEKTRNKTTSVFINFIFTLFVHCFHQGLKRPRLRGLTPDLFVQLLYNSVIPRTCPSLWRAEHSKAYLKSTWLCWL